MYKLTKFGNTVIRLEDGACIPFALDNTDYRRYLEWLEIEGNIPEPAQTPEEIVEEIQRNITTDVQNMLDTFARTRNYDGILSACTYATSENIKFKTEGQYCVSLRDNIWAKLYEILSDIQTGKRPMPAGLSDLLPDLPVLTWPE